MKLQRIAALKAAAGICAKSPIQKYSLFFFLELVHVAKCTEDAECRSCRPALPNQVLIECVLKTINIKVSIPQCISELVPGNELPFAEGGDWGSTVGGRAGMRNCTSTLHEIN